jgi:CheY-like chemotaxis protein
MLYNKALIVDDSKLARVTLKKKLEAYSLAVFEAAGAQEAFELLENESVDIVFMDHLMPDIDGFEATQMLRQQGFALPIIMCTGKEHDGYLGEALAIGANQILSKPPLDEALAAILITSFETESDETITVDDFDLDLLDEALSDAKDEEIVIPLAEFDDVSEAGHDDLSLDLVSNLADDDEELEDWQKALLDDDSEFDDIEIALDDSLETAEQDDDMAYFIEEPEHTDDEATLESALLVDEEQTYSLEETRVTDEALDLSALADTENDDIEPLVNEPQPSQKALEEFVLTHVDASRNVIMDEVAVLLSGLQKQLDDTPIAASSGVADRDLLIRLEEVLHPRLIDLKANLLSDVEVLIQKEKERSMDELLELRLNVLLAERMAGVEQRLLLLEEQPSVEVVANDGIPVLGDNQASIDRFRLTEKVTKHLDQLIEENALFAKRIQQIRTLSVTTAAAAGASFVISILAVLFKAL